MSLISRNTFGKSWVEALFNTYSVQSGRSWVQISISMWAIQSIHSSDIQRSTAVKPRQPKRAKENFPDPKNDLFSLVDFHIFP